MADADLVTASDPANIAELIAPLKRYYWGQPDDIFTAAMPAGTQLSLADLYESQQVMDLFEADATVKTLADLENLKTTINQISDVINIATLAAESYEAIEYASEALDTSNPRNVRLQAGLEGTLSSFFAYLTSIDVANAIAKYIPSSEMARLWGNNPVNNYIVSVAGPGTLLARFNVLSNLVEVEKYLFEVVLARFEEEIGGNFVSYANATGEDRARIKTSITTLFKEQEAVRGDITLEQLMSIADTYPVLSPSHSPNYEGKNFSIRQLLGQLSTNASYMDETFSKTQFDELNNREKVQLAFDALALISSIEDLDLENYLNETLVNPDNIATNILQVIWRDAFNINGYEDLRHQLFPYHNLNVGGRRYYNEVANLEFEIELESDLVMRQAALGRELFLLEEYFFAVANGSDADTTFEIHQLHGQTVSTFFPSGRIIGDLILKSGNILLEGQTLVVSGNVIVQGGSLRINGGTLVVEGNFINAASYNEETGVTTEGSGQLFMTLPQDDVRVMGNFIVHSSDNYQINNGILEVSGNFYIRGASSGFYARDLHKTLLSGDTAQSVRFDEGGGFASLQLNNSSSTGIDFDSVVYMNGSLSGSGVVGGIGYLTGGTLEESVSISGSLRLGWLNINGFTLDVDGDLTQPLSENFFYYPIYMSDGLLTVRGDYTNEGGGSLEMRLPQDRVRVFGDYTVYSDEQTGRYSMSDGYLEVRGDLHQYGSGYGFNAHSNHTTIFRGDSLQEIYFESDEPGFGNVRFGNDSTQGIRFVSDLKVGSGMSGSGAVSGAGFIGGGTLLESMRLTGNVGVDALDVNGFEFTVDGDLLHRSGKLELGSGLVDVSGNYVAAAAYDGATGNTIIGDGEVLMNHPLARMQVQGDYIIHSTRSHNLEQGITYLYGNFSVRGSLGSYFPWAQHTTVFSGSALQRLSFEISNARFGTLEIGNSSDAGVVVDNKLVVLRLFDHKRNTFDISSVPNNSIPDFDDDGFRDDLDAYPTDPDRSHLQSDDFDNDGIPDITDIDDDNDGMSDAFEIANGLDPLNPSDADEDADGDGTSNLEELLAGTDPLNAGSSPGSTLVSVSVTLDCDTRVLVGSRVTCSVRLNDDESSSELDELSGFVLNVHYDSAMLKFEAFENVFDNGLLTIDGQSNEDVSDLDGIVRTDRFLGVRWETTNGEWGLDAAGENLLSTVFTVLPGTSIAQVTTVSLSTSDGDGLPARVVHEPTGVEFRQSFSCDGEYRLRHDVWAQISIPCEADDMSVGALFGDDRLGVHGTEWVIFEFNIATGLYDERTLSDELSRGVAYWMIQVTGQTRQIAMPASSRPGGGTALEMCPSNGTDCLSIPLSAKSNDIQWNMIGGPFDKVQRLDELAIIADTGVCDNGCSLAEAKVADLMHDQIWHYRNGAYRILDNDDTLQAWEGYWAAVLAGSSTSGVRLLAPAD